MKKIVWIAMLPLLFSTPLFAQDRPSWAEDYSGIRDVKLTDRKIVLLSTKLRYTTMIVLPDDEQIVKKTCGDAEFWQIETERNLVFVKPSKPGAETNLNLLTTSGAVYSFLLKEGTKGTPDFRVTVLSEKDEPSKRKYYTVTEYESLQEQLVEAKLHQVAEKLDVDTTTSTVVHEEKPADLHFDYNAISDSKPFHVKSIYHDGKFTYIKTEAKELFTPYEVKDGKPSMLNFQVEDGTYTIPKVVEEGYLALGEKKQSFKLLRGN